MDRKTIIENFNENLIYFSFKKKDGTEKITTGTRSLILIPKKDHPKTDTSYEAQDEANDIIRYYDMESDGWRSFKLDNLINLNIIPVSIMFTFLDLVERLKDAKKQ